MDSLKNINIILSFGSEGPIQETSGSFQIEGALPGPPEPGGSSDGQSDSGSGSSLPPPPGYSSEDNSLSDSDDNSGGGPPPPPGSGNKQSLGNQDNGPPEPGENTVNPPKNTHPSPSPPPVEKGPNLSEKEGKFKS